MSLFSTDRVLVPVDFSEESFEAQKLTLKYVKDPSHLYIIHVLPRLNPGEPGVMWNTTDDETRKQHVKKAFQKRFSPPEYRGVNFRVAIGDPSSEIIDYAKEQNIDLIVIPSHGRTGLGRFFLGSVAEKVVRYAHCPVLVLRRENLTT
ncbi:MAG: universal stress protein [Prochloraceae cyanobacterium]|nr:universal stress protein [Prochloraceae cyanobacterium]